MFDVNYFQNFPTLFIIKCLNILLDWKIYIIEENKML